MATDIKKKDMKKEIKDKINLIKEKDLGFIMVMSLSDNQSENKYFGELYGEAEVINKIVQNYESKKPITFIYNNPKGFNVEGLKENIYKVDIDDNNY